MMSEGFPGKKNAKIKKNETGSSGRALPTFVADPKAQEANKGERKTAPSIGEQRDRGKTNGLWDMQHVEDNGWKIRWLFGPRGAAEVG